MDKWSTMINEMDFKPPLLDKGQKALLGLLLKKKSKEDEIANDYAYNKMMKRDAKAAAKKMTQKEWNIKNKQAWRNNMKIEDSDSESEDEKPIRKPTPKAKLKNKYVADGKFEVYKVIVNANKKGNKYDLKVSSKPQSGLPQKIIDKAIDLMIEHLEDF